MKKQQMLAFLLSSSMLLSSAAPAAAAELPDGGISVVQEAAEDSAAEEEPTEDFVTEEEPAEEAAEPEMEETENPEGAEGELPEETVTDEAQDGTTEPEEEMTGSPEDSATDEKEEEETVPSEELPGETAAEPEEELSGEETDAAEAEQPSEEKLPEEILPAEEESEPEALSEEVVMTSALEDSDGITNYGAELVDDGEGGMMIQTPSDGWNNQNQKHAEITDTSMFRSSAFTLLADVKATETSATEQQKRALFSIGNEENNLHIFTLSGELGYGSSVSGGGISENNIALQNAPKTDEWSTVALVYEEAEEGNGSVVLYLNGEKTAEAADIGFKMSELSDIRAMLGRSFSTNFLMGGVFDNIVLTNEAMDEDAVAAEAETRLEKKVSAEREAEFAEAYDSLEIPDADDVRGNLGLMKNWKNGSTIDWVSDRPDVITDSSDEDDPYDGGVVTRPAAGGEAAEVTLTATITLDGQSREKQFTVKVQPLTENLDTDYTAGYLWTNFGTSGGYEKIFFGYSEDGLTWGKLNKDDSGNAQPLLTNDAEGSDLGVRDPHVIRSADGDKYWILGTDLHAEGGGSGGSGWNQLNASQNLVVWESTDLVNWSEPRLVYAGFEAAGCVWAPEAIYDESAGDYLVYWSARDKSKAGTEENALRVYACRTRDFVNFTEPKVWLSEDQDSGSEVNIIDSTIVEDSGKYYRFSTSDWNTVIDVSDSLSEDVFDVRTNAQSSENGDWTRLVTRSGSGAAGFDRREGFTVYQLPDGRWCAMGDNGGYKAFVTDDLSSGKFTAETATFTDGRFRHGTVMRLSKAEEEALLAAYGEKEEEETPVEERILAQFDFNDLTDGGFVSENAKAEGTFRQEDSYNEENGKALYLDGSSSNFLTVTDKEGGSLLTGAKELTVSFEVKADRTSTNWVLYAAPDSSAPTYKYEKYIGIMQSGGSITLERYNNNGSRPANPSASAGNDWARVDVVMGETSTIIYVNGEKQAEEASGYSLKSILGSGSILQIGKANWGSGEYFKGWLDNLTIRNYALTAEEVAENAADFVNTLPLVKDVQAGTAPDRETALGYRGTDDHTAVFTRIDEEKKEITPYIRQSADFGSVPVTFTFQGSGITMTADGEAFENGGTLDLTKDVMISLKTAAGKEETWTIKKAVASNNPVLPGQYADPDIDYMDGKFWIFPTTDGYPSWSGTVFHAFSSEDMVNWNDEGIILDLANDDPGENVNGVQIAASEWAVGSAWAPTIEEKDGKYYFYYCGKFSSGQSAIGVAVADDPAGPYVDKGEALLTVQMCRNAGVSMGQAIDPSVFTDDDGTSYIMFGNGSAAIAQLNDDMMSIKEGTLKQITGLTDFRESVVVTKADGKYHWTWTCDDANSPNYHVNYGVSDTLTNEDGSASVTLVKKNLLAKDESMGILGSGHQSVLRITDDSGKDRYFMAYHRFYTPLDIFTSGDGLGKHRETCIDEITFDENGYMQITPTLEGVSQVTVKKEGDPVTPVEPTDPDDPVTPVEPTDPEKPVTPTEPTVPEEPSAPETGSLYTISKLQYRILSADTAAVHRLTDKTIKNVTVPDTVEIDGVTFTVTTVGRQAFKGCTKLQTVKLGDKITMIGSEAFSGCTALKKVKNASSVTLINKKAFYNCKNLTTIGNKTGTVTLGRVKSIGNSAFSGCASIRKVNVSSTALTLINTKAFYKCTSMTAFTASSKKLARIGSQAFYGCKKLAGVTLKTEKLTRNKVGTNAFRGIQSTCKFRVPSKKVNSYRTILKAKGAGGKIKVTR